MAADIIDLKSSGFDLRGISFSSIGKKSTKSRAITDPPITNVHGSLSLSALSSSWHGFSLQTSFMITREPWQLLTGHVRDW